jgi:hypothetical protein
LVEHLACALFFFFLAMSLSRSTAECGSALTAVTSSLARREQMHSGNQVPAPSSLRKNSLQFKTQQGTDMTGGSKRKVLSSGRKTAAQL